MNTVHRLDHNQLRQLLEAGDGGVARDMLRRGKRVEARAKRLAPVSSGRLRASITTEFIRTGTGTRFVQSGNLPTARVGTNVHYAPYLIRGTGIYGPAKRRITPQTARALRFRWNGRWVFARSVKGIPSNNFLKKALAAAKTGS